MESSRTRVWSKATLRRMVAKDFQKMIRLESADKDGICTCVTCGSRHHWKKLHAGHYLTGGALKFCEHNCHPQCVQCNNFLSGNLKEYARFMLLTYGEDVVAGLESAKLQRRSYDREELLEMRAGYRERWKAAERKLSEPGV